jgi:hypothetical protein
MQSQHLQVEAESETEDDPTTPAYVLRMTISKSPPK